MALETVRPDLPWSPVSCDFDFTVDLHLSRREFEDPDEYNSPDGAALVMLQDACHRLESAHNADEDQTHPGDARAMMIGYAVQAIAKAARLPLIERIRELEDRVTALEARRE